MQQGMALHQRIDAFTDAHAAVEACADLLAPRWQRYAPILVDILFDHVLSEMWEQFCGMPRERLIAGAYAALRDHLHHLPPRAQYAANMLLADDWLTCYATLNGMSLTLSRVSARLRHTGHEIELAPAVEDFVRHRGAFHGHFQRFFPELSAHTGLTRARSAA